MIDTDIQLSDKHVEIYKYIKKQEISPTYREIANECSVSLSYSHRLVKELKEMGYIKMVGKKCRTIKIIE